MPSIRNGRHWIAGTSVAPNARDAETGRRPGLPDSLMSISRPSYPWILKDLGWFEAHCTPRCSCCSATAVIMAAAAPVATATATRSLWREEVPGFWPRRAVGGGGCPPVADRIAGRGHAGLKLPAYAAHVIVAAQPIRDQDELEPRGGDVCGRGRSPLRADPRLSRSATRLPAANFWLSTSFVPPTERRSSR